MSRKLEDQAHLFLALVTNNDEERAVVPNDSIVNHGLNSLINFFPDHRDCRMSGDQGTKV
jgi:hypothetical protein